MPIMIPQTCIFPTKQLFPGSLLLSRNIHYHKIISQPVKKASEKKGKNQKNSVDVQATRIGLYESTGGMGQERDDMVARKCGKAKGLKEERPAAVS